MTTSTTLAVPVEQITPSAYPAPTVRPEFDGTSAWAGEYGPGLGLAVRHADLERYRAA